MNGSGDPSKTKGARTRRTSKRGSTTPVLPPALLGRIQQHDGNPAEAILLAAGELFTTRGPSQVSLREVAAHAGVNYGQIHHYYGTKDALLSALFNHFTTYGTTFIDRSSNAIEATQELFDADAGDFAEMLAWMVLDRADPRAVFGDTSSLEKYTSMIEEHWSNSDVGVAGRSFDPRLVAVFVMLNIMVWDFYAPYLRVLAALEDRELPELREEVLALMQTIVHKTGPTPLPEEAQRVRQRPA